MMGDGAIESRRALLFVPVAATMILKSFSSTVLRERDRGNKRENIICSLFYFIYYFACSFCIPPNLQ